MTGLRVTEVARRAGVAPSTVRFYERAGLLSPARRAANGYRVFDETALDELAFVSRAKGIGMSLDDIADLVAAWPTGECRSLQARLRGFLAGRIAQLHAQQAELDTFERQLQGVLSRLSARDPGPERCGKGCGCEPDLDVDADTAGSRSRNRPPGRAAPASRTGQWRGLAATATSAERTAGTIRLALPADPDVIGTLTALCAAETSCSAQTRFLLEITSGQLILTAHAAPGLLDMLSPAATATSP